VGVAGLRKTSRGSVMGETAVAIIHKLSEMYYAVNRADGSRGRESVDAARIS